MKNKIFILLFTLFSFYLNGCKEADKGVSSENHKFITINGPDLFAPDGEKFFIRGINLGNWLNPEGYMFGFRKTSSAHLIDQAFRQMVGPDFTNRFWKQFKDNYVTREDIRYIAKTGANTIRIPFHYKLFTDEDYMGLSLNQDGFQRLDSLVEWCRESDIYLILDMHDAPGGQTGDNIDDSFGYPWLFVSDESRALFIDIWKRIADHYRDEPVILGYDLLNEPLAPYFGDDMTLLNAALEPLYIETVAAIREVDKNHIVLLAGAQWNGNFTVFTDSKFDDKIMYTCHRYWCDTLQQNIQDFVSFRDSVNLPIFMGETGENSEEWITAWTKLMERNNIGWTYWPYKKISRSETAADTSYSRHFQSSMTGIFKPENWNIIQDFTEAPRTTYDEIRKARPNQELARNTMLQFLENSKFENCKISDRYVRAMGLQP